VRFFYYLLIFFISSTQFLLSNPTLDEEARLIYEKYNQSKSQFDEITKNTESWIYAKASEEVNSQYSEFAQSSKYDFFSNSEGSIAISEDSDGDTLIDFNFLTVVPLHQSPDLKDTYFAQFSAGSVEQFGDHRITLNGGVGYRNYNAMENMILGVNAFYDHEFSSNHYRIGFGLEFKKDLLDLNINYYEALSSEKTIKIDNVSGTEKALDGFDLEARHPLPYLPWTNANISFYKYNGHQGDDPYGFRYGAELALHDNIDLEAGYNDDRQSDGVDQNYWYAKLTYKLQPNKGPTLFGTFSQPFSERAFGTRDVKDTLLKKVRRNNKIMIERSQNGAFKVSGN
tara:strand:+ start:311 stop:1333 length:1023 start_codon:yes stop_codon:yes gene_type:complete